MMKSTTLNRTRRWRAAWRLDDASSAAELSRQDAVLLQERLLAAYFHHRERDASLRTPLVLRVTHDDCSIDLLEERDRWRRWQWIEERLRRDRAELRAIQRDFWRRANDDYARQLNAYLKLQGRTRRQDLDWQAEAASLFAARQRAARLAQRSAGGWRISTEAVTRIFLALQRRSAPDQFVWTPLSPHGEGSRSLELFLSLLEARSTSRERLAQAMRRLGVTCRPTEIVAALRQKLGRPEIIESVGHGSRYECRRDYLILRDL